MTHDKLSHCLSPMIDSALLLPLKNVVSILVHIISNNIKPLATVSENLL